MLRPDLATAYRQMLDLALPYTHAYFSDVDEWDLHALVRLRPRTFYWVIRGAYGSGIDCSPTREIVEYELTHDNSNNDDDRRRYYIFEQGILRAVTHAACARHVAETPPPICESDTMELMLTPRKFLTGCKQGVRTLPTPWGKRSTFISHYIAQHAGATRFYLVLQNSTQESIESLRIAGNDHQYSLHAANQHADGHPRWTRYFTLEPKAFTEITQAEMYTFTTEDAAKLRLRDAQLQLKLAQRAVQRIRMPAGKALAA